MNWDRYNKGLFLKNRDKLVPIVSFIKTIKASLSTNSLARKNIKVSSTGKASAIRIGHTYTEHKPAKTNKVDPLNVLASPTEESNVVGGINK